VAVTARSKAKKRAIDLNGIAWAKNPLALANNPDVDCLVELIGGSGEPALSAIETALKTGKSVVTANKALIARHGLRLAHAAEKHGGALNFEAAVGAAIPVVKTLREGLAATGVNRVYGILNGTCNYILTRMEQEGLSFAECLKDAQRLGYAEANPSFDVDGHDTAQKLAILASLAFGTKVAQSAVYVEGISSITPEDLRAASELGYRVKLLGVAVRTAKGIEQRVHPTMVPKSSSIAQVMGVTNAVTIDGEGIPPITLVGPGAGGAATASAVLADIADIARGYDVMVQIDADLSHDPADLPRLVAAVDDGADLAIGSRYVPGGSVPNWPRRRLALSSWGNRYAAFCLGIEVRDSTAGYRAYRASVLRAIDFETTHSTGYGFQIEMTYRVLRAGGRIDEVPIAFTDRVRGNSKMSWRIVVEAMFLVTWWGVRDRVLHRHNR